MSILIDRAFITVRRLVSKIFDKETGVNNDMLLEFISGLSNCNDISKCIEITNKFIGDKFSIFVCGIYINKDNKSFLWVKKPTEADKFCSVLSLPKKIKHDLTFCFEDSLMHVNKNESNVMWIEKDKLAFMLTGNTGNIDKLKIAASIFFGTMNNILTINTLQNAVNTDPLTGIYNRRAFDRIIEKNELSASGEQKNFSLIMFDIDYFKSINDTYGHTAGDMVLKKVVSEAQSVLRKGAYIIRYGGEEFLAVLPDTKAGETIFIAERMRKVIEKLEFKAKSKNYRVTASFGIAESTQGHGLSFMVEKADKMLYAAKESGRNKVVADLPVKESVDKSLNANSFYCLSDSFAG